LRRLPLVERHSQQAQANPIPFEFDIRADMSSELVDAGLMYVILRPGLFHKA
jgi:hypothetical protein